MDEASHAADPDFDGTELEFWLDEWDLTWDGGRGTNRLTRILDDRVILEQFDEIGAPGDTALVGQSWSVFDVERKRSHQTWVDNQGGYLELRGDIVDRCFAFVRAAPERGENVRQRMVFRDVEPDSFRWTWESSDDDGATWAVRWEIAYLRRPTG